MKRALSFAMAIILSSSISYSQGNPNGNNTNGDSTSNANANSTTTQGSGITRWKLDGNSLTGDKFIGTTNQKDLIFKSNNVEALRLSPNKDVKIPGQIYMELHRPTDPTKEGLLTIDYNGKVKSMEKSDLLNALYVSPCKGIGTLASPVWASEPGILWTGDQCAPAKVGIGISAPQAMLDVNGDGHFTSMAIGGYNSDVYKLYAFTQANGGKVLHLDAPNADNWSYVARISVPDGTAKALAVHNNSHGDAFFVLANGKIETHVTDPNHAIVVHNVNDNNKKVFEVLNDGVIYGKELRITRGAFPDYVFDNEYELLSIEHVKEYINKYGKLPNMPSAEQVKEEGLGVGELQTKLVEKVEELTLYIIELNEKLIKLEQENKELKKTIVNK